MDKLNAFIEHLEADEDREAAANEAYQQELFKKYVLRGGNEPGERRQLAAFDLEYFGRAYLSHYFVNPSPAFHKELDEVWINGVMKGMNPLEQAKRISRMEGCRKAIQAPRGHAKTTTFTFKDSLHASLYGYKHYIILLSDSSEQAEGFLAGIKDEIEENGAIREDFGNQKGKVWKSSVILFDNGMAASSSLGKSSL